MPGERELQILERLANLLRSEARAAAGEAGLQPVQFEILEYLARCNRYSDTPAAVTDFLGLTKGTVSQSIQRLEEKGFLRKEPDEDDGRVIRLRLTAKGRQAASGRWSRKWRAALENVSTGSGAAERSLAEALEELLVSMQSANRFRTFGACYTCRMFEHAGPRSFRCGLTGQPLRRPETDRICYEHEPAAAGVG